MQVAILRAQLSRARQVRCNAARLGMEFLARQAEVLIKQLARQLAELENSA